MEYLMTYGWAILAVAVVLAALYQLGIFSSSTFATKVPGGSCQVQRVGTGLTQSISLAGECQGQLPQYVAVFNGNTATVSTPVGVGAYVPNSNPFTVTLWFSARSFTAAGTTGCGSVPRNIANVGAGVKFYLQTGGSSFPGYVCTWFNTVGGSSWCGNTGVSILQNTWYFEAATSNGLTGYCTYTDSTGSCASTTPGNSMWGLINGGEIGSGDGCGLSFNGSVANVQVYNVSLTSQEVNALYLEGIGGAPVRPQNLVAWWQLNGNPTDYSGTNNNGAAGGGVIYTGLWTSGYTPP